MISDGTFSLPSRKEVLEKSAEYEIILVDATETPIERPKKTKTILLWKKRHTLKTQLVINLKNMQIVDLAFSSGKKHDFKLFKESCFHVKPKATPRIYR